MTPERIREKFNISGASEEESQMYMVDALGEIAAQLAELNEKFRDFFQTLEGEQGEK